MKKFQGRQGDARKVWCTRMPICLVTSSSSIAGAFLSKVGQITDI